MVVEHGRTMTAQNGSLALVPFISDGFVVCKYAVDPRAILDADLGSLVIGGENKDILAVQIAVMRHFEGDNFAEKMKRFCEHNPDSYLYRALSLWAKNKAI